VLEYPWEGSFRPKSRSTRRFSNRSPRLHQNKAESPCQTSFSLLLTNRPEVCLEGLEPATV
jgi:hypothetical protein